MNNINLADFFQRKKEQENALTKELIEKAKTLREAISHPLKIVFNAKWLLDLYTATLAGEYLSYRLGEEIKDIELWQSAWKDEIEVKYVKKNNVISIHFRLIGIVKK